MSIWSWFKRLVRPDDSPELRNIKPLLLPRTWPGAEAGLLARPFFGSRDSSAPDPWVAIVLDEHNGEDFVPLEKAKLTKYLDKIEARAIANVRAQFEKSDAKIVVEDGFVLMQWEDLMASMLLDADFRLAFHVQLESEQVVIAMPTRATVYATTIDRMLTLQDLVATVVAKVGPEHVLTTAFFILEKGEIISMSRTDHPLVGQALEIVGEENGVLILKQ